MRHIVLVIAATLLLSTTPVGHFALAQDQQQGRTMDQQQLKAQDKQQDKARDREQIYGSQLMTEQEREQHRQMMRTLQTEQEREAYRAKHHEEMQRRAKERGIDLPDNPPPNGQRKSKVGAQDHGIPQSGSGGKGGGKKH